MDQRELDEQAVRRVFTGDKAYCVDMVRRLFTAQTEEGQLMTTRLLQGIYENKAEDLHTKGLPRVERIRHYMEQMRWISETCHGYLDAAMQVAAVEGRPALIEQWKEWEQALGEEDDGEDRPDTVEGMLKELAAIMHPDVQGWAWRGATVQERRMKYREIKQWHARWDRDGECARDSPGALGLLDPLSGAGRVDQQERRGQRPY